MGFDEDKQPVYFCASITGGTIVWGLIWIIVVNTQYQDIRDIFENQHLNSVMINIANVETNYNTELISDIKIIPQNQKCPENYLENQVFNFYYNGTKQGCQCDPQRYSEFKDLQVVEGECCNKGQLDKFQKCGIQDEDDQVKCEPECICFGENIEPIQYTTYIGWPIRQNQDEIQIYKGCLKKEQGYSIKEKQPKYDNDKQNYICKDQNKDKLCGNIICFPKDLECPFSDIKFLQEGINNYEQIQITQNISLNFKRIDSEDEMPILDFQISSGEGVCKNEKNNYYKQSEENDIDYILDKESKIPCEILSQTHFPTGLEINFLDYISYVNPQYSKQLIEKPNYNQSYDNQVLKHYKEIYNINFINISETCQEQIPRFPEIKQMHEQFLKKDLNDIDQFYDLSSLVYLVFCIFMNAPMTTSLMKYNRKKLRYFLLTFLIIAGVLVFLVFQELNLQDILKFLNQIDEYIIPVKNYECPEYQEFLQLESHIQDIRDIINKKTRLWILLGTVVSSPCIYVVAGIPLILLKPKKKDRKNQYKEQKDKEKQPINISTSRQQQVSQIQYKDV